jgi:hypothetical protein
MVWHALFSRTCGFKNLLQAGGVVGTMKYFNLHWFFEPPSHITVDHSFLEENAMCGRNHLEHSFLLLL